MSHGRKFRTLTVASVIFDKLLFDVTAEETCELVDFAIYGEPQPIRSIDILEIEIRCVREALSKGLPAIAQMVNDDPDTVFEAIVTCYPPRMTLWSRSVIVPAF